MSNKVKFDGEAGSVELNRITAKKNYASSMQSHKMGATYAFDLILHKLAEEKYPDLANEVNGAVAVKQLPAVTFQETLVEGSTDTYAREFIGNFTVGADKGDKGYFGFEDERVKDVGIRLEGTDHLKGVGFNYPWEVGGVKNIRYNADKEALCIVTGNDPSKWTAILEQSFVGNKKTEGDIEAFLEQEFRPAFECAYRANPLLVGTTLTLEAMNANIDSFGNQRRADGRLYSYCEVWRDGEYDLYYLNQERGQYEPNGVNLYDELSVEDRARVDSATTLDEKNEIFIANRIARFATEAPSYFCIDDAIYQYTFLYMLVASDNFEKNMYPYKMGLLSNDSRWRFFQDDLDSIGSTDNQAQDTKSYSAEVEDFTDESQSAYVFKGEDSALWQAIRMAFPDRIRRMGRDILQAMYDLSPTGTQTLEKLMGFFDEYFFSRAQNYFPPSAYNNDAEIAYEEAWNNKDYVASVDIHPLAQSLGDHNLAERQFWEKRMLYLMSKFGFGGYGSYEDKELGVISFRTQTAQSFTLTPAIDSYPTILGGASQISSASQRVKAGTPVTLPAVGGNNTNTYIAGADWLADVGDLKDLKVDPSMVLALNVGSKRLQRLKVGDEDASAVTSTLEALAVQSCPSLTQVDARNLETLTGSVNLSRCPRLREAMFGGTNVTTVTIAAGSKIEHLQLPDSVTVLDLRNTKFLSNFELGDYTHIGFLRLENNKYIDGFSALKNAYADGGGSLQNVRIVGFNYAGDSTDADFLASLADGVYGIDSEGNPTIGKPVIEGTLNIAGSIYEDSAEAIRANYPNLTLIVEGGYYIRFADPVVAQISANTFGDGIGTNLEQAKAVKAIGTAFGRNTEIRTFNELYYFENTTLDITGYSEFEGCTNLEEVTLPKNCKELFATFFTCANLRVVGNFYKNPNITALGWRAFQGCAKLAGPINLPNLTSLGQYSFYQCYSLTRVENLGKVTSCISTTFQGTQIEYMVLPASVQSVAFGFAYSADKGRKILCFAEVPPTIDARYFPLSHGIFVPEQSVDLYKEATNWTRLKDCIFPIDFALNANIYPIVRDITANNVDLWVEKEGIEIPATFEIASGNASLQGNRIVLNEGITNAEVSVIAHTQSGDIEATYNFRPSEVTFEFGQMNAQGVVGSSTTSYVTNLIDISGVGSLIVNLSNGAKMQQRATYKSDGSLSDYMYLGGTSLPEIKTFLAEATYIRYGFSASYIDYLSIYCPATQSYLYKGKLVD